ncbi:TPA: hypothetical protein ACS705_003402 [Providencia alcalifaciens]
MLKNITVHRNGHLNVQRQPFIEATLLVHLTAFFKGEKCIYRFNFSGSSQAGGLGRKRILTADAGLDDPDLMFFSEIIFAA